LKKAAQKLSLIMSGGVGSEKPQTQITAMFSPLFSEKQYFSDSKDEPRQGQDMKLMSPGGT
jgi:hypothetical protein